MTMNHVVTQPRPPFASASGQLEVHQVPSWRDNLVWLLVDVQTREAAAVDGPEAETALAYCERHGLRLTTILNTHTHGDHIGINRDMQDHITWAEGSKIKRHVKAFKGEDDDYDLLAS